MKSLMSFVFLMPMIFSVAPLRADSGAAQAVDRLPDPYFPRPNPYPRYCPPGTHQVFDESARRYICVPNDDYETRPTFHGYEDSIKKMSGTLGGDDMAAKGAALDGLFDAAPSRKADSSGGFKFVRADRRVKPRVQKVDFTDRSWGNATGNPPEMPKLEKPQRQDPPRQDPPRQEPQRQAPPEIPKLPPSVIPGTTRPA